MAIRTMNDLPMPNLRRNYVFVGAITVMLLLLTQVIVWLDLRDDADDAIVVNLAGRQRMLSQLLTKDVMLLVYDAQNNSYDEYLDETAEELVNFERVHGGLQRGDAELGLPGDLSDSVLASFAAIQPDYELLTTSIHCILYLKGYVGERPCDQDETVYLNAVLESNTLFLREMDAIVRQIQDETIGESQRVAFFQVGFLGLNLLANFLLGAFVVRPTVQGVERAQAELKEQDRAIQAQNLNLMNTNRDLAVARRSADSANALKSQFLASMSHELRTPLNAIIGYSQLLTTGMVGEMNDEQYEYQDRVLVNANHLLGLINDILDLSKIDAGRVELADVSFNPRALLTGVVDQNRVLATQKSLSLGVHFDPRLPDMLYGDPNRVRQVVINLLSNAIKFTEKGSINVRAAIEESIWQIIVEDTGIGIPDHMLHIIFDEFRQAHGDFDQDGAGLGLAITRKFTILMGGKIEVNSRVGEGTRFTVSLPIRTETMRQTERAALGGEST
jgi:signal transduction histidine kinase